MNERLQEIFSLEDLDEIAKINRIVKTIAPSRIAPVNNKSQPWKTNDTRKAINDANKSLNTAIKYNDIVAKEGKILTLHRTTGDT